MCINHKCASKEAWKKKTTTEVKPVSKGGTVKPSASKAKPSKPVSSKSTIVVPPIVASASGVSEKLAKKKTVRKPRKPEKASVVE